MGHSEGHEHLTVQAFEMFAAQLTQRLDDGFRGVREDVQETQRLQRETNGRLRKAESNLEVINAARLIDKTSDHAQRLNTMETRAVVVTAAKKVALAAAITVATGIIGGVTVACVKWAMGW
jgi:uncharacterized membrane protein YcjF (UPF0283 family)